MTAAEAARVAGIAALLAAAACAATLVVAYALCGLGDDSWAGDT